jgi:hypothetical protein
MDHVHIELNKLGATKKTTFWNPKVSYPVETQQPGDPAEDDQRHHHGNAGWGQDPSHP